MKLWTSRLQLPEALRELAVVFLGVLFALAVNNWNTARGERGLELRYLRSLQHDLQQDTVFLREVADMLRKKTEGLAYVERYAERRNPTESEARELMNALLNSERLGWAILRRTATTFEDLRSTGNLRLIRNSQLRARMVEYYQNWDFELARLARRRSNYPKIVWELVPMEFSGEDPDARKVPSAGVTGAAGHVADPKVLRELRHELNYSRFLGGVVHRLSENAWKLLKLVDAEIGSRS